MSNDRLKSEGGSRIQNFESRPFRPSRLFA
jgi:hypothetical protein